MLNVQRPTQRRFWQLDVQRSTFGLRCLPAITPRAYGVRYLFVTRRFSLAETEDLVSLPTDAPECFRGWVKPLNPTIWNLFDIRPRLPSTPRDAIPQRESHRL